MLAESQDIVLSQGLEGQDQHIEVLFKLWEELQTSSVEAAQAPNPDLFSFLESALYFAVILQKIDWRSASRDDFAENDDSDEIKLESDEPWLHDDNVMNHTSTSTAIDRAKPPIGMVFLTSTPGPSGEISVGIILDEKSRGKGFARQVIKLLMKWAFDEMKFHRMQAVVLDNPQKTDALTLFMQLGFGHEGTRRRSIFCPVDGMWKDATYLAILDTDWFMRSYFKPAPKSLWDEMFARHQREREELLRCDKTLKRTSSMETVRMESAPSRASSVVSDAFHGSSAGSNVDEPIVTRSSALSALLGELQGIENEANEGYSSHRAGSGSPPPSSVSDMSDTLMEDGDLDEHVALWRESATMASGSTMVVRSVSPESSIDSQWDLLESSSSHSTSSFESLQDDD